MKQSGLVVTERDNGQWAALFIDPAIGQEASEPLTGSLDAAQRLSIKRAMAHRHESIPLNTDEEAGRLEEYFRALEWKPCSGRAKFLRHYGPLQLRVEQIGPQLWAGSVCVAVPQQLPSGEIELLHSWERFTDLTEEAAKRDAMATAQHNIGPAPEGSDNEWRCLSDMPDEDWSRTLHRLGFPGYPEREGMEMEWLLNDSPSRVCSSNRGSSIGQRGPVSLTRSPKCGHALGNPCSRTPAPRPATWPGVFVCGHFLLL